MPEISADVVKDWINEWREKFDQSHRNIPLVSWVGKRVQGTSERDNGFVANVVGYGFSILLHEDEKAIMPYLLTDEGLQIPIFAGMEIVVVPDDVKVASTEGGEGT